MFQNNMPEPTTACLKPRRMRKGSLVIELPSILEAEKFYQGLCQSIGYKEKLGKTDFVYDPIAVVDDLLSKGWVAISEPPTGGENGFCI